MSKKHRIMYCRKKAAQAVFFSLYCAVTFALVFDAHGVRPEDAVLERIGFEQNLDAALPLHLTFTNHEGHTVTLGDHFNERPLILVPIYYNCPMLCGLIINGLLNAIREVTLDPAMDYEIVVFSFDPKETAELAAANRNVFLERLNRERAEDGIHFLVGEEDAIRLLTDALGFQYEWVPAINDFAHASGIVIATPEGRTSHYLMGILYAPRDVRLALVEASSNRIGSPVDRLMLFCYKYDPSSGQYGLLIHRVVNTAAVTTASVLGLFLFVMLRTEKRRRT